MNRYRDRSKGIRGLLNPVRTQEEMKQDELEKFYDELIKAGPSKVEPLGDTTEQISDFIPSVIISTPEVKPKVKEKEKWTYTSWSDQLKDKQDRKNESVGTGSKKEGKNG
jgi:hypothetical protein|tara:strand:+ start:167 stop:496 length:330 start_codon:yes stop_codon:yes gene_type:complete